MPVKVEGFGRILDGLERAARNLDDEKRIGAMALEKVAPMTEAARSKIGTGSPWHETGKSAASIHAAIDKESEVGTVKVAIGGDRANAYKIRLQEHGTSKQPAYPSLRPAHDEMIGEVKRGIAEGMAAMIVPEIARG